MIFCEKYTKLVFIHLVFNIKTWYSFKEGAEGVAHVDPTYVENQHYFGGLHHFLAVLLPS